MKQTAVCSRIQVYGRFSACRFGCHQNVFSVSQELDGFNLVSVESPDTQVLEGSSNIGVEPWHFAEGGVSGWEKMLEYKSLTEFRVLL